MIRFYLGIGVALLIAGLATTIFVQKHMIESAKLETKIAEGQRDHFKNLAAQRSKRVKELTAALKEREHDLAKSQSTAEDHRRRADELANDDCLDRAVPPELDRLLRDAFPAVDAREGGEPGVDAEAAPGVDR